MPLYNVDLEAMRCVEERPVAFVGLPAAEVAAAILEACVGLDDPSVEVNPGCDGASVTELAVSGERDLAPAEAAGIRAEQDLARRRREHAARFRG